MRSHCLSRINTVADSFTRSSSLFVYHNSSSLIVYHNPSSLFVICVAMSSLNGDSKLRLWWHVLTPESSSQLQLLARYADLYLRLRRRLRIDVTGYLRRHPLSCDFLRDTPTRILVSVGASESTSLDISARHPLSCDFLRDTPTCIFVSAGASESTSLDISAAIPSVATSCEIRRLVS